MSDVVERIQARRERGELADYDYLSQFDPDADGLQLNDVIPFDRMNEVYGEDEVWGGIAGDRQMREYARTDILEGTIDRGRFARGLTSDEFNDLINYHGWNTYAWLALRATEGKSEIIPRQEYEFVSTVWASLRYPEFHKVLIDEIGLDGVIDLGVEARDQLGTAVSPAIAWCHFVVPGFGTVGLEEMDYIDADDPLIVDKKRTFYTFGSALSYGARGEDGYLRSSQTRFVNDSKSGDVVDFVTDNLVPMEPGGSTKSAFRQFNAATELLSFLLHYDNRVGQGDVGPFLVDDGKPLVLREIYINREFLPSSRIPEERDLPATATLAMRLDPDAMGLQEIRTGIGTITVPTDYLDAVDAGAVFLHDTEEGTDLDDVTVADIEADLPDLTDKANEGVQAWYEHAAEQPRRDKIMAGARVYYVGMIYPILKATGTYEYFCDELDLWELHPMASEAYYECMGEMAQEFVPQQIMFGYGWSEIPEEPAEDSRYADWLADARDQGWQSDLTGMLEVPDHWAGRMTDDRVLDVPPTKMAGETDLANLPSHVSSL